MIARRDWWIGVGVIVLALLAHGLIPQYWPRYEWRHQGSVLWLRIDRWTGAAMLVNSRALPRLPAIGDDVTDLIAPEP